MYTKNCTCVYMVGTEKTGLDRKVFDSIFQSLWFDVYSFCPYVYAYILFLTQNQNIC